jgi:hypothetical protein
MPRPKCVECGKKVARWYHYQCEVSYVTPIESDGDIDYDKAEEVESQEIWSEALCDECGRG